MKRDKFLEKLKISYEFNSEKFEKQKEMILIREAKTNPELFFKNWNVMLKETNLYRLFLRKLRFKIESISEINWGDIPEYGDHMTMEDFKSYCDFGGFIDYDGFGNYASKDKISNIEINPSDFKRNTIHKNPEFTHVVWFNK